MENELKSFKQTNSQLNEQVRDIKDQFNGLTEAYHQNNEVLAGGLASENKKRARAQD